MKIRIRNKVVTLILVVMMIVSIAPQISTVEATGEGSDVITAFIDLSENEITQRAAVGTAMEDLKFPDTLAVIVDNETRILEDVEWNCDTNYDAQTEGTYTFTPVITDDYSVDEKVNLPKVLVILEERQEDTEKEQSIGDSIVAAGEITSRSSINKIDLDDDDMILDIAAMLSGGKYNYNIVTKVITINEGPVTITGSTIERQIVVNNDSDIILNNASITLSANNACGLTIQQGVKVGLTLSGNSTIKSGPNCAGIYVPVGATLEITAANTEQKLTVTGGSSGAGIGGNGSNFINTCGTVKISGGHVIAKGGSNGAGIGGGYGQVRGTGGNVSISAGIVDAVGNGQGSGILISGAAGIGGAPGANGGITHISGGHVNTTGHTGAAGIGGGSSFYETYTSGSGGETTITGGMVNAIAGSNAAGIGGGGGTITLPDNGTGGKTVITGGTITASGHGIGIGREGTVEGTEITIYGGSINTTDISPEPTNGVGGKLYRNVLTVGDEPITDTSISACRIDGAYSTYGIHDVYTNGAGKLYFWLPQNNTIGSSVLVIANAKEYQSIWKRTSTLEMRTLRVPGNVIYKNHLGNDITGSLPAIYDGAKEYIYGTSITIPSDDPYLYTGFTFDGWYDDIVGGNKVTTIDSTKYGDVTLYARWIDTIKPTGKITISKFAYTSLLDNIDFIHFFKNNMYVTIEGKDNESGVQKIEYIKSETEMTESQLETVVSWTLYQGSFSIPANEKFIVYAKITDNHGNYTFVSSDGYVIYTDSQQDTIDISFIKTATVDVVASVVLNGNTVSKIMNGTDVLVEGSDYTVDNSTGQITYKASYLDTLAAGNYTLDIFYNPLGMEYVEGDGNQAPLETSLSLQVLKAVQVINGIEDMQVRYGDTNFTVTPSGLGNPTFSFMSSDTNVVVIDAITGEVAITGSGTATITVTATETDNYLSAIATFEIRVLANADELEKTIEIAEDMLADLLTEEIGDGDNQYPQSAIDTLKEAILQAQGVVDAVDTISQSEVDTANEELLTAIETFKSSKITVDFTELDAAIAKAEAIQKGNYTDNSWDALQEVLAGGKDVRDTKYTLQEEVAEATDKILKAIDALENKKPDPKEPEKKPNGNAEKPNTNVTKPSANSATTGDDTNIYLWGSITTILAMGLMALNSKRKREQ